MVKKSIINSNGETIFPDVYDSSYTDAQCNTAFLNCMAQKASELGMTGTHYASPSGLTEESYTTPQDMLKLGLAVCGYSEALKIWDTPSRTFTVGGSHARTITVENNVIGGIGEYLKPYYTFLGGKGGSLIYANHHRASIVLVEIEEHPVLLSVLALGEAAYNNIRASTKELADMVKASIKGQTPTEGENLSALVAANGGYAACIVPHMNANAYANDYAPSELITREHSQANAPTVSRYPASTSKTMTMLCALDYFTDLHDSITVKASDITYGSGQTFYDGDVLTIGDALRVMMMESSNTMANAIGRTVGKMILTYNALR